MSPAFDPSLLKDRAFLFRALRQFFHQRNVLEVDCPVFSPFASIDAYIDLFKAGPFYLHASPEYGMKQLLANGSGDIYQLSHVFRREESSPLHAPEFTMVEWYRCHFTLEQMQKETCDLIQLFFPHPLSIKALTYAQASKRYIGKDIGPLSHEELILCCKQHRLPLPNNSSALELTHYLWGFIVEPHLGNAHLTIIYDFPASQAALAKIAPKKPTVSQRFEVYYQGIELANGYQELQDHKEQKSRLERANKERSLLGKDPLPIDPHFLSALEKGLPKCCGVAVGFDRLMMLRHNKTTIDAVMPLKASFAQ